MRAHIAKQAARSLAGAVKPVLESLETRRLMTASNPSVVDLYMGYTTTALNAAGSQQNMLDSINRSVSLLNQTLANSKVRVSVRLVGTMQVNYAESGISDVDIARMDNTSDGQLDDLTAAGAAAGADLTSVIVNKMDAGGITSAVVGGNTGNYNVILQKYVDNGVFSHEFGHTLGGDHQHGPQEDGNHNNPVAYEGTLSFNGTTLYGAVGGSLPYFSNPEVSFRGKPTGVAGTGADAANNAFVMNSNAAAVAGFRTPVVQDNTGPVAQLSTVSTLAGQNAIQFLVRYGDGSGVNVDSLGNDDIQVTGPNGLNATATLVSVDDAAVNYGYHTALYQVATPGAVGDLAGYSFAVRANSVTDTAANAAAAATLSTASTPLLPNYSGDKMELASEEGDLANRTVILSGEIGPKYQGAFLAPAYAHFNLSADQTLTLTSTQPSAYSARVFQDKNGNLKLDGDEQISPASPNVYNLKAGGDYYVYVGGNAFATYAVSAKFQTPGNPPPPPPPPAPASLSGITYIDANNNGAVDTGEVRTPNVGIQLSGLDNQGNNVALTATSDANGVFTFSNLQPGNYTLRRVRINTVAGKTVAGTAGGTAPTAAPDFINGINLTAGTQATGYLYAALPSPNLAALSGSVYIDANNDGIRQTGEAGIASVPVTLTGTDLNGLAVNTTVRTDPDGNYGIFNVAAAGTGGYTLSIVQPANVIVGKNTVGSLGGKLDPALPNQIVQIPLNGADGTKYLFGEQPLPANPPPPPDNPGGTTTTGQNTGTTGNVGNPSQIVPIFDYANGFATAGNAITANGSAVIDGPILRLTNASGQAASAYYTNKVNVSQFKTQFNLTFPQDASSGDGMTFVIQGNTVNTTGGGGGSLGFEGMGKSVAIKFDLYNNAGEGSSSTGLYINGAPPYATGSINLGDSGIDLHNGNTIQVTLEYNGSTLISTITDLTTGRKSQVAYPVNIASIVGGSTAFVGFTAGTGGASATQSVGGWTYNAPAAQPNLVAQKAATFSDKAIAAALPAGSYAVLVPDKGPQHARSFTLHRDGTYEYVPARDYVGKDSFTYEIVDANGRIATATMNLLVQHVTQPTRVSTETPQVDFTNENTAIDLDMSQRLDDAQNFSFKVSLIKVTGGTAKVLSDGHTIRFIPAKNFVGTATIEYLCNNGLACSHLPLQIAVLPVAKKLVANKDSAATLPSTAVSIDALKNDTDPAGVHLCLSSVADPAHGTASIDKRGSSNPANWRVVYRPDFGFHGTDTFTYTLVDFLGTPATGTISVTVTPGVGVGVSPIDGKSTALDVFGTAGNDTIDIFASGNGVGVKMNGKQYGTFKPTGLVAVFGGAGNDTINSNYIPRPVWLFGDDGNDTLRAGSADDLMVGGLGRDRLHGHAGADRIVTGTVDYATRGFGPLANLFSGGTTLASTYVHDDNARDDVWGDLGHDRFWANATGGGVKDVIYDRQTGESLVDLG